MKIILAICAMFCATNCVDKYHIIDENDRFFGSGYRLETFYTHDEPHEYISGRYGITHCPNCKYCKENVK